jgi:PhnB protein
MTTSKLAMGVQPYLFFGGRCEEAIEFYRKALGAEVEMSTRFNEAPEKQPNMPECFEDKIMHATLRIGDTILMASDGRCEGEANFEGFSLSITVADEAEAERVFAALSEGGLVTMALEKTFWAPKFGMLQDRFGVGWMVSVMHKPEGTG